jgi:dolichol-phosphate mannosyltransferase
MNSTPWPARRDGQAGSAADEPAGAALAASALSIVIPVYNEIENLEPLLEQITRALQGYVAPYEIIAVDDGSTDGSMAKLRELAAAYPRLRVIRFRRNRGQTAALMAGFDYARGGIIVPIDADLQNDPQDIPKLLALLNEGYEVVSGWRKDRQDAALRRILVSRVANRIISWMSGVHLHDYGCTLKAYRRDVLQGVRLYGEMHRFIPIYASWMGGRVTEMPVHHHPRRHGKSKYGLNRIGKVLLDLVVLRFLDRYFTKPIYIFGGFGILFMLVSFAAGLFSLYLKLFEGKPYISTPLPLLVVMSFITGVMSILMGLLGETLVRIYFETQGKTVYEVKETINF